MSVRTTRVDEPGPLGSRRAASPGVGAVRGAVVRPRTMGAGRRGARPAGPGRTTGRPAAPPRVDRRCPRRGGSAGHRGGHRRCPTADCRSRRDPVRWSRRPSPARQPRRTQWRWRCRSIPGSPPTVAARCTTTAGRATPTRDRGPLGRDPEVDTAWYGLEECATLAFDRHDASSRCAATCAARPCTCSTRDMRPLATQEAARPPARQGHACLGEPVRRRLLLPRRAGPRGGGHHRRSDPRVRNLRRRRASHELRQERAFDVSAERARRRLPGRADAGLGRA